MDDPTPLPTTRSLHVREEDDGSVVIEVPPPAIDPRHRALFRGLFGCGGCATAVLGLALLTAIGGQVDGISLAAFFGIPAAMLLWLLLGTWRWCHRARGQAARIKLEPERLHLDLESPSRRQAWSWPGESVHLVRIIQRGMGLTGLAFPYLQIRAGDDVVEALGLHEPRTLETVQQLIWERYGMQTGTPSPPVARRLAAAQAVLDSGPRWSRWLRDAAPCPVWVPDPHLAPLPAPLRSRLDVRDIAPERVSVRAPVEGFAYGLLTALSALAVVLAAFLLLVSFWLGPLSPFEGSLLEDPFWLRVVAAGSIALILGWFVLFGSAVARRVSIDVCDGELSAGKRRLVADELITLAVGYFYDSNDDSEPGELRPRLEVLTSDGRSIPLLTGRQDGLRRRGFLNEYELLYLADRLQRALTHGARRGAASSRGTTPGVET